MAKVKKEKIPKEKKPPATSIFDHISWLTNKKRKWEELSYEEQKSFNVYMVNRFFSMEPALCEAINEMQEFTASMNKKYVWKIYHTILPNDYFYLKYIKPTPIEGVNEEDIKAFIKYFSCTEIQAIEYIQLLQKKGLENEINEITQFYK